MLIFTKKKPKKNPPNLLCYRNEQVASFSFIIKKNMQNSYFIDTPPTHTHWISNKAIQKSRILGVSSNKRVYKSTLY